MTPVSSNWDVMFKIYIKNGYIVCQAMYRLWSRTDGSFFDNRSITLSLTLEQASKLLETELIHHFHNKIANWLIEDAQLFAQRPYFRWMGVNNGVKINSVGLYYDNGQAEDGWVLASKIPETAGRVVMYV